MALLILIYVAAALFVLGNVYRIARIARTPAHLRWELFPIPRGSNEQQHYGGSYFEETEWWTKPRRASLVDELSYMLREVLTFTTLRKRNQPLWLWSWLMHLGLYALVATMAFILISAVTAHSWRVVIQLSALVSSCAGLAGVAGLFSRRLADSCLRSSSSRADFANLFLIAAVFASGAFVHLSEPGTQEVVTFVRALLRLGPPPVIGFAGAAHVTLLAVFAAYFPATHMTHAYMKFFTYHRVRWDDVALAHAPSLHTVMGANVRRPITWAASHIAADGTSTWADVVTRRRT